MAIGNGVVIRFLADTGSAVRNIGKLEKATGKAMGTAGRARAVWSKLVPALAGGALAAGYAVGKTVVDGVQAAIEDQASSASLAQAMRQTVGASAEEIAGMEDYIDAAQRRAAVDDGEVRKGLARLLRSTKSTTRAQALMNTAMEISAQTGKPLGAVVEALAKYNDGNANSLKRLGVTMGDSTRNYGDYMKAVKDLQKAEDIAAAARETYGPKSKEYAAAQAKVAKATERIAAIKGQGGIKWLAELNEQFKGSVASKMGTTAGAMQSVATAYGELVESLGKGVVGSNESAAGELNDLADAMYDAQPTAEALGGIIHDLGIGLANAATYIGPVAEGFERINNLGDGALTNGTITQLVKVLSGDVNTDGLVGLMMGGEFTSGTNPLAGLTPKEVAAISNYYTTPRLDPNYGTADLYRYNTRATDSQGRGDARGAQRNARTRTRP